MDAAERTCQLLRSESGGTVCSVCGWTTPKAIPLTARKQCSGTRQQAARAFADDAELARRRGICAACPELAQLVLPDDPAQKPRPYCTRDLCDDAGRRRCDRRAAGVYAGRLTKHEPTCERWGGSAIVVSRSVGVDHVVDAKLHRRPARSH